MTDTIPHLAERAATPAELADEDARRERARTGRQLPRTLHALCEQVARLLPCGHCGARPGSPCVSGPPGYHLARFAAARRHRLLLMTATDMATVLDAAGDVFTNATIIRDGAR